MLARPKEPDPLAPSLEPVLEGLGLALVELNVSRHRGSVSVRAVLARKQGGADMGLADCSRAHRAMMPRIGLAFPGADVSVEVSSPGLERQFKNSGEFRHFVGRTIACYRTDGAAWTTGVLERAGNNDIVIRENGNMVRLDYEIIGKAKLSSEKQKAGVR